MQLITAYISVVLIWATTPLAIQWSSESVGFLFGMCSRFILGAIIASSIALLFGKKLSLEKKAIQTYLVGGIGLSLVMLCVYWGAQFIPSGWISVIYGISPIITGILAGKILNERGITLFRFFAIALSVFGLYIMLKTGLGLNSNSIYGIAAVIVSAMFYSLNMVAIKKINADIDSFSSVMGTLLVAALLFLIIGYGSDIQIPTDIPIRALLAILYLALIGSVLGFLLFYYVLKRIEATRASLITLITPLCALMVGHFMNNEPLSLNIFIGCLMILSGLILFEFEVAIRRMTLMTILRIKNE